MEEAYKNKVITISGEPASGKGTTTKALKKYYEEQGCNVHIISTGNIFREMAVEAYKKEHPEIEEPSIELVSDDPTFKEKREEIDRNIDSYIAQKGIEINSMPRPNDVYIFDSRLAFSNVPNSFSIRLTVDEKVAGERVFNDETRGVEDQYETLEQAIEDTRKRKEGEVTRYEGLYDVDLTDENNYDLVINTSYAKTEDIVNVIIKSIELAEKEQPYSKTWASPKWFLPLQNIRSTGAPAGIGLDLNGFEEKIKEEGYDFSSPIEVIQVDGYYYIIEGHHRNFAAGGIGMTLVPYDLLAKDDEIIGEYHQTARERVYPLLEEESRNRYLCNVVYDHEGILDEIDENGERRSFYYTQVYDGYPKIPEKNQEIENEER